MFQPALQESRKREWNGDVDLLDGKLEALRTEYEERRKLATSDRLDVELVVNKLTEDKKFLLELLESTAKVLFAYGCNLSEYNLTVWSTNIFST